MNEKRERKIASQTIILSLKKQNETIVKMYEKVEIMFKTHFLSSSITFTNNIQKLFYILSASDKETRIN